MSEQCKEKLVAVTGGWGFHRCYNKAKKDGWCMVHHPDSVAKRDKKAKELSEQNWADSPSERLRKANDRIKELEAQLKASKTFAWESTNRERLIQAGWTPPEALEQD